MLKSTKAMPRTMLACTAAVLMVLASAVPAGASAARASLGTDGQYVTDDGAYAVYVLPNDPGAVGIAQVLQGSDTEPATVTLNGVRVPVHATDTSAASGAALLPLPIDMKGVQQAVLDGTNAIRTRVGAGPVVLSDILSQAALVRATEMAVADEMTHTRPNGENWSTVISGYGTAIAENVVWPDAPLEEAGPVSMDLWEHSEVHYNNIVDTDYTNIGVGCARSANGSLYICQLLSNGDPGMDPSDVTIDTVKMNGTFTPDPDTLQQAPAPEESAAPEQTAEPAIIVDNPLDPSMLVTSDGFAVTTVGDTAVVTGMKASFPTTVDTLLAGVQLADGSSLQLSDANGTVRQGDSYVATGDHLWASGDSGFAPTGIILVVEGDVLGTGTSSLSQVVRMAKAFTGDSPLTGVYLAAADTNKDGSIGLSDLVDVCRSLHA